MFSTIFTLISAVATILRIYISYLLDNIFIGIIFIYIMLYTVRLVNVLLIEVREVSATIKSKHSDEHMMVNFLEANKRLPKNMAEIKSTSRFSNKCGSRKKVESLIQDFVISILALMIAIFVDIVLSFFVENTIIESIIVLVIY